MGPAHYIMSKTHCTWFSPKREERQGKQYYNIHAKHMYYYSNVLEMVTYKMETQLNMLHSK